MQAKALPVPSWNVLWLTAFYGGAIEPREWEEIESFCMHLAYHYVSHISIVPEKMPQ